MRYAVGGAHRRRTGPPQRRDSDWTEMREVLSDWYQQELYDLDMGRALRKLVKIFESNALMLPGLAGQIKKLTDNQGKGQVTITVFSLIGFFPFRVAADRAAAEEAKR